MVTVIQFAREGSGVKLMYLDESGDHNLEKIDPNQPVFVLGGVIVDRAYARTALRDRVRELKYDFFGTTEIVLHTNDIIRSRNGFEPLADSAFREDFYEGINAMMAELDYQVVACVIDKPKLVAKYGRNAEDPYHYGLHVLIERFCNELGECVDGGIIYAEKRGDPLDFQLSVAWEKLRGGTTGTGFANSRMIDDRICELVMKEKKLNNEGLQLADLVISPVARRAMRRTVGKNWDIVKSKFRRSAAGQFRGYGLITLP